MKKLIIFTIALMFSTSLFADKFEYTKKQLITDINNNIVAGAIKGDSIYTTIYLDNVDMTRPSDIREYAQLECNENITGQYAKEHVKNKYQTTEIIKHEVAARKIDRKSNEEELFMRGEDDPVVRINVGPYDINLLLNHYYINYQISYTKIKVTVGKKKQKQDRAIMTCSIAKKNLISTLEKFNDNNIVGIVEFKK